jgi:hypothetical protein
MIFFNGRKGFWKNGKAVIMREYPEGANEVSVNGISLIRIGVLDSILDTKLS